MEQPEIDAVLKYVSENYLLIKKSSIKWIVTILAIFGAGSVGGAYTAIKTVVTSSTTGVVQSDVEAIKVKAQADYLVIADVKSKLPDLPSRVKTLEDHDSVAVHFADHFFIYCEGDRTNQYMDAAGAGSFGLRLNVQNQSNFERYRLLKRP